MTDVKTLRDEFAMAALPWALVEVRKRALAHPEVFGGDDQNDAAAVLAYKMADAMMNWKFQTEMSEEYGETE